MAARRPHERGHRFRRASFDTLQLLIETAFRIVLAHPFER
jgi:hypothetical protein